MLPPVGLRVAGSGDPSGTRTTCIGGACTSRDGSAGYDDRSDFGLGVDALIRAGSSLRVGAGLWYIPTWRVASGEQSAEIGSELSLPFIVEGILPASPTTLVAIRGQGGPLLFKTGGTYADGLDCERSSQETPVPTGYGTPARSCESDKGPFFGYTWGGAVGAIFLAGTTRLRADLLLQGYHVPGGYKKVAITYPPGSPASSYSTEKKETLSGTRLWLTFGVEL